MLGSVMFASKILLLYKNICDIFLTYLGIYNHFDLDFTKVISALLRMVFSGNLWVSWNYTKLQYNN